MKQPDERHFSEEELLMHLLGEEVPAVGRAIASHLLKCGRCNAVFEDYRSLHGEILAWRTPEVPELVWQVRNTQLMDILRKDRSRLRGGVFSRMVSRIGRGAWGYALENPLPTLGYVIVVVAFASERTISVFRLDRILPATSEVLAILRQVL